jgi:hypothetical protein
VPPVWLEHIHVTVLLLMVDRKLCLDCARDLIFDDGEQYVQDTICAALARLVERRCLSGDAVAPLIMIAYFQKLRRQKTGIPGAPKCVNEV